MNRRLWVPLLAVLLVAVIVGPGTVTATEPRVTTRTVTIPAAAFQPSYGQIPYYSNWGHKLTTGNAELFVAPLSFEAPVVYVKRITLVAYDNLPDDISTSIYFPGINQAFHHGTTCAFVERATPMSDSFEFMGGVCSDGMGTLVREFTQRTFDVRRITGAYGPYLLLWVGGSFDISFNAVKITYTY
jgi:hypothetical protein